MLIFDEMIVVATPATAAVARKTPLLDFDQHDFERQPAVGEDAREVDQLLEHIEQRTPLRAAASGNDLAAFAMQFHQVFGDDHRFDDEDVVLFDERGDLIANRRERSKLDFDQLFAADDVDAISPDALFDQTAVRRVVLLQLAVEGSFHEGCGLGVVLAGSRQWSALCLTT